jgi:hypothetical protein
VEATTQQQSSETGNQEICANPLEQLEKGTKISEIAEESVSVRNRAKLVVKRLMLDKSIVTTDSLFKKALDELIKYINLKVDV